MAYRPKLDPAPADPRWIERPRLRRRERLRRELGALFVDGFFKGSARLAQYSPLASPRLHGVDVLRDVPYASSGSPEHRLDIYRPRGRRGPLPVLLYLHGGGFRILSKDTHWIFGYLFARRGYLVVNASYRLAPRHPFPAAVADACQALEWVVRHAKAHGGDLDRLVFAGESAGANLVTSLSLATSYRRPEPFARRVFDLGVRPKATIAACGLYQVTDPERYARERGVHPFILDRLAEIADAYVNRIRVHGEGGLDLADPVVALERGEAPERALPPFFLPCGDWDPLVHETHRLADALRRLGVTCAAPIYPFGFHAFHAFVPLPNARRCWRDTYAFLDQHLDVPA